MTTRTLIEMPPDNECLHCWLCATILAYETALGGSHDDHVAALTQLLAELVVMSKDTHACINKVRENLTLGIQKAQADYKPPAGHKPH